MTKAERITYHKTLWPAACRARGWDHKDKARRHAVCLDCMREIRGPLVTTSDRLFGRDETTALFTYLRHLADDSDLNASADWDECKRDYKTFNRARQADWHERKTYGKAAGKTRLDRHRFRGAQTAAGDTFDTLDPEEVRKHHLTMARRHAAKTRRDRQAATATPNPFDQANPF